MRSPNHCILCQFRNYLVWKLFFVSHVYLKYLIFLNVEKKHIFLKGWNKRHTFYCQVYLCIRITRPLKHTAMVRHAIFQFECCGVNKVVGTINDFEPTYWCMTEGSCHATSSQIPRTCCKGFTENDYQNAPIECKSSVKSGSYYDKVTTLTNRKNIMLK